MIKRSALLIFLSIFSFSAIVHAKNCKKSQRCGNSCISWNKTCHIGRAEYKYVEVKAQSSSSVSVSRKSTTVITYKEKTVRNDSAQRGNTINDYKMLSAPQSSTGYTNYEVTATKLKIREIPDSNGKVVGYLEKGNLVTAIATIGNWKCIRFNGLSRWVNSSYLKSI